MIRRRLCGVLALPFVVAGSLWAQAPQEAPSGADQEAQTRELAKASQNPIGNLISLPFQNNTSFLIGRFDRTSNVLNIQPVIPADLSGSIRLINRAILPVVSAPDATRPNGTTWGLGDLNYTAFFTSTRPGAVMVGAGPVLLIPTGTSDETGSGKWGAGPSVVVVARPGSSLVGILVNNIWSYAGDSERDSLNQMLIQYFINYNFPGGWYLTSAPIITSDWTKPASEGWIVPLGGGVGKLVRLGRQPISFSVQAFYNVVTPEDEDGNRVGPEWSLRLRLALLFPK